MKLQRFYFLLVIAATLFIMGCDDDSDPQLTIPDTYVSSNFAANTVAESTVVNELADMTGDANDAEANAQSGTVVAPINYPATLASVTLDSYEDLIEDWLVELVAAANSPTRFQNPGLNGTPVVGEEGGLLGSRLVDENGLELEQMIQKGSFGAALYNHALSVINGDLSDPGAIDKLVEVFGTETTFNPENTTAAATYARRRSFSQREEGLFFDIKNNLITARAAIEAGSSFNTERDQALDEFLLNWEKSNFATVIYYCDATRRFLQQGTDESTQGTAIHAYAEGVAFAHGFRRIANKRITDDQIDQILDLLLAPVNGTPESHRFLNDASLLQNLQDVIDLIQGIYNFTDDEVTNFFTNDPV